MRRILDSFVCPREFWFGALTDSMDPSAAVVLQQDLRIAMWRRGNLTGWYLKPKQQGVLDFIEAVEDPFVEASRRYGKTTTVLGYCIQECIKRPGIIVRWCEPWQKQCREIVMTEMDQIQKDIPEEDRFRWKTTDSVYCHPNGSKIYLRGVNDDRGESARGPKAHIVVCDELGSWRYPDYTVSEVLGPQLLTTKGKLIFMGTPPKNLVHYFYSLKKKAILKGRHILRTVKDQELVEWEEIEKAVERAGGWDSPAVKREYLCEEVVDTNFAIIPEWDDRYIQDVAPDDFFPFYLKYEALDIGVRHLTFNITAYYDFRRAKLVILDEFVINGPKMTTEKVAEGIREREERHFGVKFEEVTLNDGRRRWKAETPPGFKVRRISDVDLLLVQDLSKLHALYYDPTDKGELDEMTNETRIWVGAGKILVHPRCEKLIQTLKYGMWDEDRKDWEESEELGHCDGIAALNYLVRNIDQRTNPIPSDFQRPSDDYFHPEGQGQKEKRNENFKKMFNVRKPGTLSPRRPSG
jgi:hypothetical protein